MSLSAWPRLDDEGRRVALDALLEQLPDWLELLAPGHHPRFRDRRSGESWRLFADGEVELGATPARLEAVADYLQRNPMALFVTEVQLPPRRVRVAPFLLMERPLFEGDEPQFFFLDVKEAQARVLARRGQRLPTEAEWELAWWAVQAEREHWVPGDSELCADAWRPTLAGLVGQDPCEPGGPGVVRSGSFDAASMESVLPARQPLSGTRLVTIRPALDVPGSS